MLWSNLQNSSTLSETFPISVFLDTPGREHPVISFARHCSFLVQELNELGHFKEIQSSKLHRMKNLQLTKCLETHIV
jgi:hypothetical protein